MSPIMAVCCVSVPFTTCAQANPIKYKFHSLLLIVREFIMWREMILYTFHGHIVWLAYNLLSIYTGLVRIKFEIDRKISEIAFSSATKMLLAFLE